MPSKDKPEPFEGWLIYPNRYPCEVSEQYRVLTVIDMHIQISQAEVDKFSDSSPLPCCLVTVLPKAGEDSVEFLRYPVVIENVDIFAHSEMKLFIHCSMKQFSTGN